MLKRIQLFVFLLGFSVLTGCENSEVVVVDYNAGVASPVGGEIEGVDPETDPTPLQNLVDTIRAQSGFQFFADALEFTQLDLLFRDESLAYTITVPTDAVFDELSPARRVELLSNPESLRQLLLRHVSPTVDSSATLESSGTTMLDGSVRVFSEPQFVNQDIEATNGVVHGINILLDSPTVDPDGPTVLQALSDDARFSGVVAALESTVVGDTLSDPRQNLTFFAPTNNAFVRLGQEAVIELYANRAALADLLQYHIITSSMLEAADFGSGLPVSISAANGDALTLLNVGGALQVDAISVLPVPVPASNGVIYIIDTVLAPSD